MVAGAGFVHRPLDGEGEVKRPRRLLAGDHGPGALAPDAGQEGADAGAEGVPGGGGFCKGGVQSEAGGVPEGAGQEVDLQLAEG